MSPVLSAYFEGKRMREERENKQQQQIFQQQKIEQENQRIKLEADQQKAQEKQRIDALNELKQAHTDAREHNAKMFELQTANSKQAQAVADSTLMQHFLASRYRGEFNPPSVPDSGPAETSEMRPQREIQPFQVPGTEGRKVITPEMWREPGSVQMARIADQGRLAMDKQRQADKTDLEQQNLRNMGMLAAITARAGAGQQIDPEDRNRLDNAIKTGQINFEQWAQSVPQKQKQAELSRLQSLGIVPLSKEVLADLNTLDTTKDIMESVKSLKESGGIIASKNPFSEYTRVVEQIKSRIGMLRDPIFGKGLGVLSKPDLERMEGALPKWKDYASGQVDARINEFLELYNKQLAKAYSKLAPAQREHFAGSLGKLTPLPGTEFKKSNNEDSPERKRTIVKGDPSTYPEVSAP